MLCTVHLLSPDLPNDTIGRLDFVLQASFATLHIHQQLFFITGFGITEILAKNMAEAGRLSLVRLKDLVAHMLVSWRKEE